MKTKRALPRALAGCMVLAAVAAGCGDTDSPGSTGPGGSVVAPEDGLKIAQAATATARKGTNRPVDPTSRPAAKGKKVAVISAAQFVISSQVPADAAKAAAEAAGWQAVIYDAENKPAKFPELVRQATAAGVDAIVLVAIDCQTAKQPLQEAKAKGIAITSVYAFDCSDPKAGGDATGVFSANTNFGPAATNIDDFTKKYGADQANYIVADSNNEAKIIEINAPEFTVLNWTAAGFEEQIQKSGGSEIVSKLEVTTADITNGTLRAKVEAELLRHPEATWVKSPFTYVTTLGVGPALGAKAGVLKVMGGEGYRPELDLMKEDKVTAINVISSEWNGWAAIDSLNSVFLKKPPVDSGIGWTIVDKTTPGIPATGEIVPPIDFKAAYKKAWGVG